MKRSYSFRVEKEKRMSGKCDHRLLIVGIDTQGLQCIDDNIYMGKVHPYPRGKFLKITYTLAPKTGEFIIVTQLPHSIFFEFVNGKKETPEGKFLNCLIHECDWEKGTRFNRKVEVISKREAAKN